MKATRSMRSLPDPIASRRGLGTKGKITSYSSLDEPFRPSPLSTNCSPLIERQRLKLARPNALVAPQVSGILPRLSNSDISDDVFSNDYNGMNTEIQSRLVLAKNVDISEQYDHRLSFLQDVNSAFYEVISSLKNDRAGRGVLLKTIKQYFNDLLLIAPKTSDIQRGATCPADVMMLQLVKQDETIKDKTDEILTLRTIHVQLSNKITLLQNDLKARTDKYDKLKSEYDANTSEMTTSKYELNNARDEISRLNNAIKHRDDEILKQLQQIEETTKTIDGYQQSDVGYIALYQTEKQKNANLIEKIETLECTIEGYTGRIFVDQCIQTENEQIAVSKKIARSNNKFQIQEPLEIPKVHMETQSEFIAAFELTESIICDFIDKSDNVAIDFCTEVTEETSEPLDDSPLPNIRLLTSPLWSLSSCAREKLDDLNRLHPTNYEQVVKNERSSLWCDQIIHAFLSDSFCVSDSNRTHDCVEATFIEWIRRTYKLKHIANQTAADVSFNFPRYHEDPFVMFFLSVLKSDFSSAQLAYLSTIYQMTASVSGVLKYLASLGDFPQISRQLANYVVEQSVRTANCFSGDVLYTDFLLQATELFGRKHAYLESQAKSLMALCGTIDSQVMFPQFETMVTLLEIPDCAPKKAWEKLAKKEKECATITSVIGFLVDVNAITRLIDFPDMRLAINELRRNDYGFLYANFLKRTTRCLLPVIQALPATLKSQVQEEKNKLISSLLQGKMSPALWHYRQCLLCIETETLNDAMCIPIRGKMSTNDFQGLQDYFDKSEAVGFALLNL